MSLSMDIKHVMSIERRLEENANGTKVLTDEQLSILLKRRARILERINRR